MVSKLGYTDLLLYFCGQIPLNIMMKTRFRIWALCVMMALLGATCIAVTQQKALSEPELTNEASVEGKQDCTMPGKEEERSSEMLSAPAQLPAIVPSQSSRLVTPAKYRTSLMRTNIMRRSANRLCDNIYTPLALSGQFVVERVSSPLRKSRAVNYYVITLCRLLC